MVVVRVRLSACVQVQVYTALRQRVNTNEVVQVDDLLTWRHNHAHDHKRRPRCCACVLLPHPPAAPQNVAKDWQVATCS